MRDALRLGNRDERADAGEAVVVGERLPEEVLERYVVRSLCFDEDRHEAFARQFVIVLDGARHGAANARASMRAPDVDHDGLTEELRQGLPSISIQELREGHFGDLLADSGS